MLIIGIEASKAHETCEVEVLMVMTKGGAKDILSPLVWATPKALKYWEEVAAQDMEGHAKQMEGYAIGSIKGMSIIIQMQLRHLPSTIGTTEAFNDQVITLRAQMKSLTMTDLCKSHGQHVHILNTHHCP